MKKLILIGLAVLFSTASFSQKLAKGYVYEDANKNGKREKREAGIPGVAVSNGSDIAVTDDKGYYELPVSDHCVIFVIKPKGYIAPVNDKFQPQSYYIHKPAGSPAGYKFKGSDPTGPLPASLDFPLLAYNDPVNFTFFAFGDPQPYSLKELEYFQRAIVAEAKEHKGPVFGISLGDICGEKMDMYPAYLDVMSEMGIPWYNAIGNHDRNYDATSDELNNESFEASFGPSDYAFRYGDTHFIVLDDIMLSNPPKGAPYVGGLSETQFKFIENYLKLVTKGELVILSYHIPIAYKKDQFRDTDRRRLLGLLEGHNVLGLSAHTHIQMQFFLGKDLGWNGKKPFHEYNVATSNGDWYSGKHDKQGLPDATMRDGTPQGYAIVSIDGDRYTFDYKVAGKPAEEQITIYNPRVVPYKQGGKYPVYANFYIGGEKDKVEFRIDGGDWKKMSRADETDPTFMNLVFEWDRAAGSQPGRRPNSTPTICTHLWKGTLDNSLEPGEHTVEVRATDLFGRTHTATHKYRTEKTAE